jgi:hypothetical protein
MVKFKIIFIILVLLSSCAFAQTKEEALDSIDGIHDIIDEMKAANFSVLMIEDLFEQTNNLFSGQEAIEDAGDEADYTFIIKNYNDIKILRDRAFSIDDEIFSISSMIDDLESRGIDVSTIDVKFLELETEFGNGRYDQSEELIEELYADVSEAEAESAQVSALYESSRKTLTGFLEDNWQVIIIVGTFLIASVLLFYNEFHVYRLNNRKKRLHFEKHVVTDLIRKVQRQYFENRQLSEGQYTIKISKFRELIRDIDRMLPIINEKLAKTKTFYVKPHLGNVENTYTAKHADKPKVMPSQKRKVKRKVNRKKIARKIKRKVNRKVKRKKTRKRRSR